MVNLVRVLSSISSRAAGKWRLSVTSPRYSVLLHPRDRVLGSIVEGCDAAHNVVSSVRGFHSSWALLGAQGEGSNGPTAIDHSSLFPEKEFHNVSNETLHHLQEKIDEYGEKLSIDGFDTDYAEGVLTVRLGHLGTYVINKQTPNRQIWLSSPVSGPARFDWQDSKWLYRRTKAELISLLETELSQLLGHSVDLK